MKVVLFSFCVFFSAYLNTAEAMSANPKFFTASDDYHIVKKGETLESISKKYSLPIQRLKLFNDLKKNEVFVGQKLYLYPKKSYKSEFVTERPIPKSGIHIVKAKESIHRIAKMYGLNVFDILEINDLNTYNLKAGQRLLLRKKDVPLSKKIIKKQDEQDTIEDKINTKNHEQDQSKIAEKIKRPKICLPVNGKVTSEFGLRNGRPHKGIDIAAEKGKPILASLDGKVVYVGNQRGYGNVIILEHDEYVMTVYAHNETNFVRLGEKVKKGQPIATLGQTGSASGPHLHFEYRKRGKAIDPRKVLPDF